MQLVLSGDFCQLPPVPDRDARGAPIPATFAFDAECWDECVGKPICLKKVFRQKDQGDESHSPGLRSRSLMATQNS